MRFAGQSARHSLGLSCGTSPKRSEKFLESCKSGTIVSLMKTELVTTLKRQATRILREVNDTLEPVLITEHGIPSVYLIDAQDYERRDARLRLLEGLARGEAAFQDGRVVSHEDAKQQLDRWLR
jgi:prevent-host-death family protein